ncbi:MAG: tetratricopeptide repeat protein [Fibrobacteria bacterium]|nr:tetratricopeptide repeat protein [Fibrobacteria bacterium]
MSKIINCITFLLPLSFFWGCASSSLPSFNSKNNVVLPEIDVIQVKENSDEALKISRDAKLDIDAINTKLIEIDNKLLIIGEELSTFSAAKLEELENRVAILAEENRLLQQSVIKGDKKGNKNETSQYKQNTFTPKPSPKRDKPILNETESQTYKMASDLFYARKFTQAIAQYDKILKEYPKGVYGDNANYWKAECHYAMGNYAKAINSYQRIFSYPNSEKGDDAQFKIGMSYLRTGDKNQAVTELKKLLSLYPDSEFIGRAKKELSKLE